MQARLISIIRKEFIQIMRDPRTLAIIFVMPVLMLFLCSFATCAGSTGGGIKLIRSLLLLKQARRELTRIVHPRAVVPVTLGGAVVPNQVLMSVLAFMLFYGSTMVVVSMLLMFSGLDLVSATTATIRS